MGVLTEDMKQMVREQRLGYVATVCADGTPNLSPKGTTTVWDDDHADRRKENPRRARAPFAIWTAVITSPARSEPYHPRRP